MNSCFSALLSSLRERQLIEVQQIPLTYPLSIYNFLHFWCALGWPFYLLPVWGCLGCTPYADLAARVAVPNYGLEEGVAALPLTPVRYAALRTGLALLVGLVGTGLVISWRHRGQISRRCSVGFGGLGTWLQPFKQLSCGERWLAGALLITAAGVHLWYAINYPLMLDEIASYDYSVLPGAALTASYYPFPNNH
jgi:hypothetical protein